MGFCYSDEAKQTKLAAEVTTSQYWRHTVETTENSAGLTFSRSNCTRMPQEPVHQTATASQPLSRLARPLSTSR